MLALWSMLAPRFRPPVGAPRGVRLLSSPLHVMQLAQEAEVPQLVRATRVDMVHLVSWGATEDAASTVPANDRLTDLPPAWRQRAAAP